MWIKHKNYIEIITNKSRLEAKVEMAEAEVGRLEREVDYWRGKFESAQNRADRVADLAFETSGFRPISDLGVTERDKRAAEAKDATERNQRLMTEMFADEIGGDEGEGDLPIDGFGIESGLVDAIGQAVEQIKATTGKK